MNDVREAPGVEVPTLAIPDVGTRGDVLPAAEDLPIWHEAGTFWIKTDKGMYVPENSSDIRRDLRWMGFDARAPREGGISEVDEALRVAQHERSVAYVGPFAGKRKGLHAEQGRKILVTEDFSLIEPKSGGDFPVLQSLIEGLLDSGGVNQSIYFYAWLRRSYESLAKGELNPGQAVALVGPRACGKSLLQTVICTILGGRSADPFLFMTGATPFNSDLFRAEVLLFGDKFSGSSGIVARRKFGSTIKEFTSNEFQSCHKKQKEALPLRPFWRVIFSINDEPENLLVLPPLDESIQDKLFVFKTSRPSLFDTPGWGDSRPSDMAKLVSEIPYFLDFLLRQQVPTGLKDIRFGIRAFQHPDIMVALDSMSPEERMLELVDEAFFPEGGTAETGSFSGKASAIERRLVGSDSSVKESARGLLSWPQAASTYLGRLAAREDGRVTAKTARGGYRVFTISHPRDPGRPGNQAKIDPEGAQRRLLEAKSL